MAVQQGASELWKNLPVLVIVLAGGFTTNFVWCLALNIRNKTWGNYFKREEPAVPSENSTARTGSVPLLENYVFCALAGTIWYLQFLFYGMGTSKMGRFDFSVGPSHGQHHHLGTLVESTSPVEGSSRRTRRLMISGLIVLVASTMVTAMAIISTKRTRHLTAWQMNGIQNGTRAVPDKPC